MEEQDLELDVNAKEQLFIIDELDKLNELMIVKEN